MKKFPRCSPLILALLGSTSLAQTTLISDPFSDGDRSNGADPLDSHWYPVNTDQAATITVTAGALAAHSGNQPAAFRFYNRFGPAQDLAGYGLGESLTLRFSFQVDTPITENDNFCFGLFDTRADGIDPRDRPGAHPGQNRNDAGYAFLLGTGPGSTSSLILYDGPGGDLGPQPFFAPESAIDSRATESFNITGTGSHTAELRLERTSGGLQCTVSIDGSQVSSTAAEPIPFPSIDGVKFGMRSANTAFQVDDIVVETSITVIPDNRPNILFCMADDWGWPHAGAYGQDWLATPGFDRIADEGVLFRNAFTNCPSCTPSRGCTLTGRYPWRLEEGSSLWGPLPAKFPDYPTVFEDAGYAVGYTGKGWGPGDLSVTTRTRNPAGPAFNSSTTTPPAGGMSNKDYIANFRSFLDTAGYKPFCFWYGAFEPHRAYEKDSGRITNGMDPAAVDLPAFYPDAPDLRNDMLDYGFEVEYLDQHLVQMLAELESRGLLDNTIIMVTGDHGMPFPRCKGNLYEWGTHVPFAVRWGNSAAQVPGGRTVDDIISFVDVAPTLFELTGVTPPDNMELQGRSFANVLHSTSENLVDPTRDTAILGIERHGTQTVPFEGENLPGGGYPSRAIRTLQHLYIRNYHPEWDASGGDGGPALTYLKSLDGGSPDDQHWHDLNLGNPRAAEELYDIVNDPDCVTNLLDGPGAPGHTATRDQLRTRMESQLRRHRDPRTLGFEGQFYYFYRTRNDNTTFPGWLPSVNNHLSGDSDSNGQPQLLDHFLMRDLFPGEPGMEAFIDPATGKPVLRYKRPRDQTGDALITGTASWSTDLENWSTENITETVVAEDLAHETIEARLTNPPGDRIFFRLSVTFQPGNYE
jgi:N-sulfoglucosamine sulfohydrolase